MDLILFVIFVATLIAVIFPRYKDAIKFQRVFNKIPGPPSYPIIGTLLPYIRRKREGRSLIYR